MQWPIISELTEKMCMRLPGAPDSGAVSPRFVFAKPLFLSTESPNTEIPSPAWAPHTEPSADKYTVPFMNHKYPSAPLRQDLRVCCGSLTSTRFWLRSSAMSSSRCLVCSLSCMLWAVISFWACTRSSTVTAFTPSCERGGRGVTFSTDAYTSSIWKCWLGRQLTSLWNVLPPPVWIGKGLWSSPYECDKRSIAAGLDRTVLCVSAVTREKLNNNVMTKP